MQGVRHPPPKKNLKKIKKREGKINKIKKIYKNYHNYYSIYKWVKNNEFLNWYPHHHFFFEVCTSLLKINPACTPVRSTPLVVSVYENTLVGQGLSDHCNGLFYFVCLFSALSFGLFSIIIAYIISLFGTGLVRVRSG